MAPTIHFFYDEVKITLSNRTLLKKFIPRLFAREKRKCAGLNYIFCSDERLLEINRRYLRHDYYTDIITFDLSGEVPGEQGIRGEIYISVDRVRDNARQLGVSFTSEIHRVIFHGALHLCGYRDKTKAESVKMRKMEEKYLGRYREFLAANAAKKRSRR